MKGRPIAAILRLALPAASKARPAPAQGSTPSTSPTDVLFELRQRFDAGAISEHEYAAKRRAMLTVR
jgi:hypothetical protein